MVLKEEEKEYEQCFGCNKPIDISKDKYIEIITLEGREINEDKFFHANCWVDYFNNCVLNKFKLMANQSLQLLTNFNTPTPTQQVNNHLQDLKQLIIKKKQKNGKRKGKKLIKVAM